MSETTSGLWDNSDIYRRVSQGTWADVTGPGLTVAWSPEPAGTPFTTGSYSGVDFTASATLTVVNNGDVAIEYVVVAGGGTNGSFANYKVGSGGGGGGFRSGTLPGPQVTPGTYPVIVGGGGSPSVFASIISQRGGGGHAGKGGSGGGGQGGDGPEPADGPPLVGYFAGNGGGLGNLPSVSPTQGYNGGSGGTGYFKRYPTPSGGTIVRYGGGGGGGGAGGVGGNGGNAPLNPEVPGTAGNGGSGRTTTIKGSPLTLGGGGGGSGRGPGTPPTLGGIGGAGGGGNGGGFGVPGEVNTGGGGGSAPTPRSGGSGRVIIRWLT